MVISIIYRNQWITENLKEKRKAGKHPRLSGRNGQKSEHEHGGLFDGAYVKFDVIFIQGVGRTGIILIKLTGGFCAVFQHVHSHGFQVHDILFRSSAHKGSAVLCVDFPKLLQSVDIRLVDALCSSAAPVIAAGAKFAVNPAAAPKRLLNDLNPLFSGSIFNQNRFHKDHRAFFLSSIGIFRDREFRSRLFCCEIVPKGRYRFKTVYLFIYSMTFIDYCQEHVNDGESSFQSVYLSVFASSFPFYRSARNRHFMSFRISKFSCLIHGNNALKDDMDSSIIHNIH